MKIKLNRLYLENYKLFSLKEITFEDSLSVFDGPNGYGKTSIFDAIEFLVTGTISRIKDCNSIAGNTSYAQNHIANNPRKDTIIKGEFLRGKDTPLVILIRIPASTKAGKVNNPKQIDAQANTYFLPDYNTPKESWNTYLVDNVTAQSKRNSFFGSQNLSFFTLIHYIQQEDRLSYFKKSEADRTTTISKLFGIESEQTKVKQLDQAHKQLSKRLNEIKAKLQSTQDEIAAIPADFHSKTDYVPLAGGQSLWDCKDFGFKGAKTNNLFNQALLEFEAIRSLFRSQNFYFLSQDLRQYDRIPNDRKPISIQAWFLSKNIPNVTEVLSNLRSKLTTLEEIEGLIDQGEYLKIDYNALCKSLNLSDLLPKFNELLVQAENLSKNQTDLEKTLSSILRFRNQLHQKISNTENLDQSSCPYCGYNWNSPSLLEEQYIATQDTLNGIIERNGLIYTQIIAEIKKLIDIHCLPLITNVLNELKSNPQLKIFMVFPDSNVWMQAIQCCDAILKRIEFPVTGINTQTNPESWNDIALSIMSKIDLLRETIPTEYRLDDEKYKFQSVYSQYFAKNNYFNSLTEQALDAKYDYIRSEFYLSFNSARETHKKLLAQKESLEELMHQIKCYHQALNHSISQYQELVIGQIEIPFFLYSSRLLQSYHGGQGVMIKSDGQSIRFVAPGAEHDVIYTMSSGQLSAVLLAFSLSLSKIYAGDSFQTILIDDPIQCMDDINMISFVELLRREFSSSQIILSTHEDSFSNYIQYKFEKYRLSSQSITLKHDMES